MPSTCVDGKKQQRSVRRRIDWYVQINSRWRLSDRPGRRRCSRPDSTPRAHRWQSRVILAHQAPILNRCLHWGEREGERESDTPIRVTLSAEPEANFEAEWHEKRMRNANRWSCHRLKRRKLHRRRVCVCFVNFVTFYFTLHNSIVDSLVTESNRIDMHPCWQMQQHQSWIKIEIRCKTTMRFWISTRVAVPEFNNQQNSYCEAHIIKNIKQFPEHKVSFPVDKHNKIKRFKRNTVQWRLEKRA